MHRHFAVLLVLVSIAGCSEPFIVFAGGELSGEERTPPDDWSLLRDEETFQLETRPDDPYSVNIWAVGIGRDAYIGTGPDGTRWSGHIDANPQVRLRVGEVVYPLLARPVTNTDERRAVAHRYAEKYGMDQDENWLADALVYRLDRR